MFETNLFDSSLSIDPTAEIIVISDLYASDYVGGAELTTQALIDESPFKIQCLKSNQVTMDLLRQGHEKFWIFGNFANLNSSLIPTIVANLQYSIVEYDFKFCRFRSPEKHEHETGSPCDCDQQMNGKVVSSFFHGARSLWWMSERQMRTYHDRFPFLASNDNHVLSSVFSKRTLATIKALRESENIGATNHWIILGSNSWVKGFEAAKAFCEERKYRYEAVWNVTYEELLTKLSYCRGIVYHPAGSDTCPRFVIEAKLLRCQLELNDNVLHKDEEWFATDDIEQIESYLYKAPTIFWNAVKEHLNYVPTISGYVTTYNCIKQGYPIKQCIESMLKFCDEVCVVDGGSTDNTLLELAKLQGLVLPREQEETFLSGIQNGDVLLGMEGMSKIKVKIISRDWSDPRFAVFDGLQKAKARSMCTKEFCWQMDADEVVHENDVEKIKTLATHMSPATKLLALPVVEFWGPTKRKVRMDVMPWKWRLSRNDPDITHGIPKELRSFDSNGQLHALPGTDGCDYISRETLLRIPFMNFYDSNIDRVRTTAITMQHESSRQQYEAWFNAAVEQLPSVWHYSWIDFERKIRLYRDTWTKHWQSLYNLSIDDTAENNMFFNVPWKDVTDQMISDLAKELETTGGHVYHHKWNHDVTPYVTITKCEPASMAARERSRDEKEIATMETTNEGSQII